MRVVLLSTLVACAAAPSPGPLPPPTSELRLSVDSLVLGQPATWTVDGLRPGERVYVIRGNRIGAGACPSIGGGLCLDITGTPSLLVQGVADAAGTASLTLTVPGAAPAGIFTSFQAVALRGPGNTDSAKSNPVRRRLATTPAGVIGADADLVISEVMANPAAVSDTVGEWFEVTNVDGVSWNLEGLDVSDDGGTGFVVDRPLILEPGESAVFGRSGDPSINGGALVDFAWVAGFSLSNSADEIILSAGGIIDRVTWGTVPTGASLNLAPTRLQAGNNDDETNWCDASRAYGDGDLGTPGMGNDPCGTCGNGAVEPGEDCDDTSPSCDSACLTINQCGDGQTQGAEDCDLGLSNGTMGVSCALDCTEAVFDFLPLPAQNARPFRHAHTARDVWSTDLDGDGLRDAVFSQSGGYLGVVPGRGDGTFDMSWSSAEELYMESLQTTDVDLDGIDDVVAVTHRGGELVLFHGSVDGPGAAETYATGLTEEFGAQVRMGDVDDDGRVDAVVFMPGETSVSVLRQDATGLFAPTVVSVPGGVYDLHLGDVTGDGLDDIVTVHSNSFSVMAALPDGTFSSPSSYSTLVGGYDTARDVELVDLSGDGKQDVVVLDLYGGLLQFISNWPLGFDNPVVVPIDGSNSVWTRELESGDADGDGLDDIALVSRHQTTDMRDIVVLRGLPGAGLLSPASYLPMDDADIPALTLGGGQILAVDGTSNLVRVLQADGAGWTLLDTADVVTYPRLGAPVALTVADLDDDGLPDLATSSTFWDRLDVHFGDGANSFITPFYDYDLRDHRTRVDLDGDGQLDVIGASSTGLAVRYAQSDGTFSAERSTPSSAPLSIVAHGDVDEDGDIDVVAVRHTEGRWGVLLNNGDDTFTEGNSYGGAVNTRFGLWVEDVSGDGHLDVVFLDTAQHDVAVQYGDGTGAFGPAVFYPTDVGPGGKGPERVIAADLDEDGAPDLVTFNADTNDLSVLLGTGNGQFSLPALIDSGPPAWWHGGLMRVRAIDLDVDGYLDLLVSAPTNEGLQVFRGYGNGSFGPSVLLDVGAEVSQFDVADYTGDGRLDVLLTGWEGASPIQIYMLLGQ